MLVHITQDNSDVSLPHSLSAAHSNYNLHSGILRASHQFLYVLRCQEMPMT